MFKRGSSDRVRELVEAARPVAAQAASDEELRRRAAAALRTALRLRARLLAPVGLGVLGTRLVYDRGLQEELRQLREELSAVGDRARRARSLRRRRLMVGAVAGVGAAGAGLLFARAFRRYGWIVESVAVRVPLSTAYNQWTQFEEFPKFMQGVEDVRQVDDTHLHWVAQVAGKREEWDAEITEQKPDDRIAWRSTGADHGQAGVVTFHRLSDGDTRVTVQMEWQPEGLLERAGSVIGYDRRRVRGDLRRFKHLIESRGEETGSWRGEVKRPEERATTAP
jgi:uncharacterized membrane protein